MVVVVCGSVTPHQSFLLVLGKCTANVSLPVPRLSLPYMEHHNPHNSVIRGSKGGEMGKECICKLDILLSILAYFGSNCLHWRNLRCSFEETGRTIISGLQGKR